MAWRARGLGVTIALAIILLIVPGAYAQSQAEAAPSGQAPGAYLISVDVALVVLPVTVRDRQGQHAPICKRAILRFMKTTYCNPSGCSGMRIFQSSPDCWSTTAAAWPQNLPR